MFVAITITAAICLAGGIVVGRLYEAKIQAELVAKSLAEFAAIDHDARTLVTRVYSSLAGGIRRELDRLLPR